MGSLISKLLPYPTVDNICINPTGISALPIDVLGYLLTFLDVIHIEQNIRIISKQWCYIVSHPSSTKSRTDILIPRYQTADLRRKGNAHTIELLDKICIRYPKIRTFKCEMFNIGQYIMPSLLKNCSNIRSLDMATEGSHFMHNLWTDIINVDQKLYIELFERLYTLKIECFNISHDRLSKFSKVMYNLRTLHLQQCNLISSKTISIISKDCPKLQCFKLSFSHHTSVLERYRRRAKINLLDDVSITELCTNCPLIRCMYLDNIDITDDGIRILSHQAKNLRKLTLKNCRKLTYQSLIFLADGCPSLQKVKLYIFNKSFQDSDTLMHVRQMRPSVKFMFITMVDL